MKRVSYVDAAGKPVQNGVSLIERVGVLPTLHGSLRHDGKVLLESGRVDVGHVVGEDRLPVIVHLHARGR